MSKIKQNKITFFLILSAIIITFSSITILSLPVLFNYKSKVEKIEKNYYNNFKLYMNTSGIISYKPFPKPHLLVENASLSLSSKSNNNTLINTSNLKIFISLRDIYLRSFKNFISSEISKTNLEFKISQIKGIRKHLYEKVNKPIVLNDCKIFIENKNGEVILISPIKKIFYKINNKTKIKNLMVEGKIFGIDFKSDWRRSYDKPKISLHNIELFNPNIEIRNLLERQDISTFKGKTEILYAQDKLEYNFSFDKNKIKINSPNKKNINFNINSDIRLKPFYFDGSLSIKNKNIETIIDNILLNLILHDQKYIGNFNGILKINFSELNNKLIKKGLIELTIKEKQININSAIFNLDKIGKIKTNISIIEKDGIIKFFSKNQLYINNHIEFAKIFQVGSNKVKKIKKIYFDIEKNIGESDFIINNVRINNVQNFGKSDQIFIIKNIQNLRMHLREFIN